MTVYATHDSEDGYINQNASIFAFDTEAAAREYLLGAFDADDWRQETAVIKAGRYGDAWIKVHSAPADDAHYFAPFSRGQLRIARPGQHPGGRAWWIEPSAPVLVVASIEPRE